MVLVKIVREGVSWWWPAVVVSWCNGGGWLSVRIMAVGGRWVGGGVVVVVT